ncbi:MAG: protein kinase [Vicinamibacterales bacterium]
MIGQHLGHYRIVRQIGAGGMGVVYEAEDTTLGRQVALKVLPPGLAADGDRRQRFAREAKAVAALNHPNIVTLHSVEEAGGVHFITMELVKGRTLAELLPRRGLSLDRFFALAIPLADAVSAAHQQGIAHRDLKPANVMVGDDGRLKVLDFGLAKGMDGAGDVAGPTQSATGAGLTIGTPAYMSPEQAQGEHVDTRSDIFSLGIVFYEMLTGRRPFDGDNAAAVMSAILRDTPKPVSELQPAVPRALARMVERCLAKRPLDRFQSAVDLRHSLEEVKQDVDSGDAFPAPAATTANRLRIARLAAAVTAATALALAALGLWSRSGDDGPGTIVPQFRNPLRVASALDLLRYSTWSPDGQRLAYESGIGNLGNSDIWVAQPGGGEPVNLTRDSGANDRRPSWSPNGREIAFLSNRDGAWGVYLMAAIGGGPRKVLALSDLTLTANSFSTPQWARDGSRLFVAGVEDNRNVVIDLVLATLEHSRIVLPVHSSPRVWDVSLRPDGGRFAYLEAGGGNPELTRLWTVDASGNQATPLTDGRSEVWSPSWSNDGRRVFYASNRGGVMDLWQQVVGADGAPIGDPVALTSGLDVRSAAFSPDGSRLAYSAGGRITGLWRLPILVDRPATWSDATQVISEPSYIEYVDVSPDGRQLAVSSNRRGNQDLWLLPAGGGEMTPLTTDPTPDWNPRWSPDGRQIAFYAYRSGNRDIWVMPAQGGPARQLTFDPAFDWYPSWSPDDGREINFVSQRDGGAAIWAVAVAGGEPHRIAAGGNQAAEWSPDGKWLAFVRQGKLFRLDSNGGAPVPLSTGSHVPSGIRLSRDGGAVFYSINGGPPEEQGLWRLSLADGKISRLARFEGRRGALGYQFAADAQYLYVLWNEFDSAIWATDAVTSTSR